VAPPARKEFSKSQPVRGSTAASGASLPSRSVHDAPRSAAPSAASVPSVGLHSNIGALGGSRSADEVTMMRYIGANWPKYRDTWLEMRETGGMKAGFSFAAFFFGELWLLYRKQYAFAFALMAGRIALAFVATMDARAVLLLGVHIALGVLGKSLIVRRAMTTIGHVKALQLTPELEVRRIEKAGGTSWTAVVLLFGLMFLAGIVSGVNNYAKLSKDKGGRPAIEKSSRTVRAH
jgi:hypothetical protein